MAAGDGSVLVPPTPTGYKAAQLRARSLAGNLTEDAARDVIRAVDGYADALAKQIAALPAGTPSATRLALEKARTIALQAEVDLQRGLSTAIAERRTLAFKEVFAVWEKAGRELLASEALVPNALLGAIRTPAVLAAGAYANLGGAFYLKTLSDYGKQASAEVDRIITGGLLEGISPHELADRIAPYVKGAEEFERLFPAKDARFAALRKRRLQLPPELRGAAGRVKSNALRIAYSEVHNARVEAELSAFALDPLVKAVRWALSPNRGSQTRADVCDGLARNNWYGLGVGIYPLDKVPLPPHPRDRCERIPVTRPPNEWGQPKPRDLSRTLKPVKAKIGGGAGGPPLTAAEAQRVRDQLRIQFQQLDRHSSPTMIRRLMDEGEAEAKKLEAAVAEHRASLVVPPPPPPPPPPVIPPEPPPPPPPPDDVKPPAKKRTPRKKATPKPKPEPKPTAKVKDPLAVRGAGWHGPDGPTLRQALRDLENDPRVAKIRAEIDRLLAVLQKEADAVDNKYWTWSSKHPGWGANPHQRERSRLRARRERLMMRRRKLTDYVRRRAEALLRADEPSTLSVTLKSKYTKADASVKARHEAGIKRFRDLIGNHRTQTGGGFFIRRKQGRAYYMQWERSAYLSSSDGIGVVVHELVHGYEYNTAGAMKRAQDFRAYRAAGEKPQQLKKLVPGSGYGAEEIAVKDKFWNPYAGKVYSHGATEILTMGVQRLVEDPLGFAKDDPEYFDFIVETLWGKW